MIFEERELLISAADLMKDLIEIFEDEDVTKEQLRLASHALGNVRASVKCVLRGMER